jgi:hypothetical protein
MVISSVCSGRNIRHGSGRPNHSKALTGHSASARRIEPTCEVARAARPPDSEVFELRPRESWADKSAYGATTKKLAALFNKNFETYAAGANAEMKARSLWLRGRTCSSNSTRHSRSRKLSASLGLTEYSTL